MKKYLDPFWMSVTTVLSILLIVLLYPLVSDQYGALGGGGIVAGAVAFIWVVYAVRAYIFVKMDGRRHPSDGSLD